MTIRWTASLINKDIAGFYVVIRNAHNRILLEHHLPYDRRIDDIIGSEICNSNCNNLELCVLSKNSHGSINNWFDAQCVYLPQNFDDIRDRYDIHFGQIYVIHSVRRQVQAKGVHGRDSLLSSDGNTITQPNIGQMICVAFIAAVFNHFLCLTH